jgi:hypothetical protein
LHRQPGSICCRARCLCGALLSLQAGHARRAEARAQD